MNEILVRLCRNGAAVVPGGLLRLGYAGNHGNYQLRVEQYGEWADLTVQAHWHLPGASGTALVKNGTLDVPPAVTAQPGTGCITFEGSDGSRTVTSADVRFRVAANSGPADSTLPQPGTPAWEALIALLGVGSISAAEKQALLELLQLLAQGNDAAMAAYDALAALWSAPEPPDDTDDTDDTTARLGTAVLGRMILGRSET